MGAPTGSFEIPQILSNEPPTNLVIERRSSDGVLDTDADADEDEAKSSAVTPSRASSWTVSLMTCCGILCDRLIPLRAAQLPSAIVAPTDMEYQSQSLEADLEVGKRSPECLKRSDSSRCWRRKVVDKSGRRVLKACRQASLRKLWPSYAVSDSKPNFVTISISSLLAELDSLQEPLGKLNESDDEQLQRAMMVSNIMILCRELAKEFSRSVDNSHRDALGNLASELEKYVPTEEERQSMVNGDTQTATRNINEDVSSPSSSMDDALKELARIVNRATNEMSGYSHSDICARSTYVTKPQVEANSLRAGVVLVALVDAKANKFFFGSGFIVDAKRGLVVTAAHVVIDMGDKKNHSLKRLQKRSFGSEYYGMKRGRILIGVHGSSNPYSRAEFRYGAIIEERDVGNQDAVVLRINTVLRVEDNDSMSNGKINICDEGPFRGPCGLKQLQVCEDTLLEERIRILGYNQGQIDDAGSAIGLNRNMDVSEGKICLQWDNSRYTQFSSEVKAAALKKLKFPSRVQKPTMLVEKAEIQIECTNIGGHSGGPVVNDVGSVVGILSSGSTSQRRGHVVPAKLWMRMVKESRCKLEKRSLGSSAANGGAVPISTCFS